MIAHGWQVICSDYSSIYWQSLQINSRQYLVHRYSSHLNIFAASHPHIGVHCNATFPSFSVMQPVYWITKFGSQFVEKVSCGGNCFIDKCGGNWFRGELHKMIYICIHFVSWWEMKKGADFRWERAREKERAKVNLMKYCFYGFSGALYIDPTNSSAATVLHQQNIQSWLW